MQPAQQQNHEQANNNNNAPTESSSQQRKSVVKAVAKPFSLQAISTATRIFSHVKGRKEQLYFHGDKGYFLYMPPSHNAKRSDYIGLPLQQTLTQFSTITNRISLYKEFVEQKKDQESLDILNRLTALGDELNVNVNSIRKYAAGNNLLLLEVYSDVNNFAKLLQDLWMFGNLPSALSIYDLLAHPDVKAYVQDAYSQWPTSIENYKVDFEKAQLSFYSLPFGEVKDLYVLICMIAKKKVSSNNTAAFSPTAQLLANALAQLLDYLYKQIFMKQLVHIINEIYEILPAQLAHMFAEDQDNDLLACHKQLCGFLCENSAPVPIFEMFAYYEVFCRKIECLAEKINDSAPHIAEGLRKKIKNSKEDHVEKSTAKKYEALVNDLYTYLYDLYAANSSRQKQDWNILKPLLYVMSYLNSEENPYRYTDYAKGNKDISPFHKEALSSFASLQDQLSSYQIDWAKIVDEKALTLFWKQYNFYITSKLVNVDITDIGQANLLLKSLISESNGQYTLQSLKQVNDNEPQAQNALVVRDQKGNCCVM